MNSNTVEIFVDATNALDIRRIQSFALKVRATYTGLYHRKARKALDTLLPSDVKYVASILVYTSEQIELFRKKFRVFSEDSLKTDAQQSLINVLTNKAIEKCISLYKKLDAAPLTIARADVMADIEEVFMDFDLIKTPDQYSTEEEYFAAIDHVVYRK